jgi:glyoxylase-like metal-dependent hydrolase (beta-lactamase superfamily II)
MHRSFRLALVWACALSAWAQVPELEKGTLPDRWITGGPNCAEIPDWQVHEYNPTFLIIRESGCTHYEKPFLYLIFGSEKALLVDTGAGEADTAAIVRKLMKPHSGMPLLVVHSHGHGDHVAGDKALRALPDTTVAEQTGAVDLGGRVVDVIPIPGHHPTHAAYYDRRTGILLTGDHLYPGRLYVADFAAYLASTSKLVEFTATRPVAHILGCHIEQSATPFVDYPVGTKYQPLEHRLELGRSHLLELLAGLEAMQGKPVKAFFRDFTIWPK